MKTLSEPEHRKQCRLLKLPLIHELRGIEDRKCTGFFTYL